MSHRLNLLILLGTVAFTIANAQEVKIPMYLTNESETSVGYITAADTQYGVMFTPHLLGVIPSLSVGAHGFHVHENPSCAKDGMAAGGHLDPKNTKHHYGPYNNGHLGDLPVININADGSVSIPVVAPRLSVKDILGHSLMIHNGSDNYSDDPKPLGGGGPRMICGVIPSK